MTHALDGRVSLVTGGATGIGRSVALALASHGSRAVVNYRRSATEKVSLQPGDVILTGTPPGVGLGQKPPTYLRAGQEVRAGVQGLGEQRQRVVE